MSIHVISWVLRHSKETLGRRLVLLVLADHAKEDGTCAWPSVPTIAHDARLSERQVQNCLRAMEAAGVIVETGVSKSGTHIYTIVMSEGGANIAPRGVQSSVPTPADIAPDPSLEQPSEDQELATAHPARPRDLVWDELADVFGVVVEKTNAHAKRNKAVADLKRQEATPETIRRAARTWPHVFPGATLTDVALATHFVQLLSHNSKKRELAPVEEVLDLPDVSEEERIENLRILREMTSGIGREESQ